MPTWLKWLPKALSTEESTSSKHIDRVTLKTNQCYSRGCNNPFIGRILSWTSVSVLCFCEGYSHRCRLFYMLCFWIRVFCVLPSGESDGACVPSVSVGRSRVQFLPQSGSQEETNHHHGPLSQSDTKRCLTEKGGSQSGPSKDVHLWCGVPSWRITGKKKGFLTWMWHFMPSHWETTFY